jgi:hypothetical protein
MSQVPPPCHINYVTFFLSQVRPHPFWYFCNEFYTLLFTCKKILTYLYTSFLPYGCPHKVWCTLVCTVGRLGNVTMPGLFSIRLQWNSHLIFSSVQFSLIWRSCSLTNSIQFISSTDHYTWYGTRQRLIHNINIIMISWYRINNMAI